MSPDVVCFFDDKTNSASYVVSDPDSGHAAIIDPVLDFDPISGRTSTESAEKIVEHVADNNLTVDWLVETHVHADHLTASEWLKQKLGGKTGVGAGIKEVRSTFGALFNATDVTEADHVLGARRHPSHGPPVALRQPAEQRLLGVGATLRPKAPSDVRRPLPPSCSLERRPSVPVRLRLRLPHLVLRVVWPPRRTHS